MARGDRHPGVAEAIRDDAALRRAVLFEGASEHRKRSRFWMLLSLAAVIATAGVIADSEATVIGAMLVAPLRIPILGTTLAVVLGDRVNLRRAVGLVVGGAAATVAVGYLMGLAVVGELTSQSNGQVATWSHAGLVDLVAALAVGAVGSIALLRDDIGDAVPGVAIAISLVPPLAVTGIALESRAGQDALGAVLLFGTNVAAILAIGVVVLRVAGVRATTPVRDPDGPFSFMRAYGAIGLLVVVVTMLLGRASWVLAQESITEAAVSDVVGAWASEQDWDLVGVTSQQGRVVARVAGAAPLPRAADLATALRRRDVDPGSVDVEFLPRVTAQDMEG